LGVGVVVIVGNIVKTIGIFDGVGIIVGIKKEVLL